MFKGQYFYGLGRRKRATARARLYAKGKGNIYINDQPALEYLSGNVAMHHELMAPLSLIGQPDGYDVSLRVSGGGLNGQVDASKLAIAKALSAMNDDLRTTLKKAGLLKRDPREKERQKPGLKGARRKEQFSKR
jgi:small subunit ribosomal protein S9